MAEDGKIVYKVHIDDSDVEQQAGAAGEKAGSSFGSKLGSALGKAGKIGAAAVGLLATGTAAATSALVSGTKQVAAYGDNIDKMSQKLGMSAEAYQEWDAIMQHSGTTIDAMQSSMKTLATAAETGAGAFEDLGLSLDDIANMSQEELFAATITALQNVDDETQRTYLAGKLLGRGATELGALLNMSAEETETMRERVHELGGVMSDEAVKAAAAYQDSLQDMQTAMKGLTNGMLAEFLPGVTTVMDGLAEIFSGDSEGGLSMVSDGVSQLVENLTEELPRFMEVGVGILESIATAILSPENVENLLQAGTSLMTELIGFLIESAPMLLEVGLQLILALADGLIDALPELIPAIVDVILTIVEKLTEPDTVVKLVEASFKIMAAIAEGLIKAIPVLVERVPEIIMNLLEGFVEQWPEMKKGGMELLQALGDGIMEAVKDIVLVVDKVITSIFEQINENLIQPALSWGSDMIGNFIEGIVGRARELLNTVKKIANSIKNFLGFSEPKEGPLSDFHTYAPDMVDLFAQGLKDNEIKITRTIADVFDVSDALRGVSGSAAADYAAAMPSYASGMLERSASEAISYSSSVTGGATYYIYNTIDADNVKSFNDVVELCQSAETVRRMF
jgi:hypothetical protein